MKMGGKEVQEKGREGGREGQGKGRENKGDIRRRERVMFCSLEQLCASDVYRELKFSPFLRVCMWRTLLSP